MGARLETRQASCKPRQCNFPEVLWIFQTRAICARPPLCAPLDDIYKDSGSSPDVRLLVVQASFDFHMICLEETAPT